MRIETRASRRRMTARQGRIALQTRDPPSSSRRAESPRRTTQAAALGRPTCWRSLATNVIALSGIVVQPDAAERRGRPGRSRTSPTTTAEPAVSREATLDVGWQDRHLHHQCRRRLPNGRLVRFPDAPARPVRDDLGGAPCSSSSVRVAADIRRPRVQSFRTGSAVAAWAPQFRARTA